ncbi:hypothetical protein [Chroococcidiopsis sp.]|uniref:hypothetical protein n=1 Tax=Chroococcidiopsis sp. TaxID=3088168 RepID=UPI003F340E09
MCNFNARDFLFDTAIGAGGGLLGGLTYVRIKRNNGELKDDRDALHEVAAQTAAGTAAGVGGHLLRRLVFRS